MDPTKKSPQRDVVPYVGHLSLVERAQIANWFDKHITAGDPKLRLSWLGLLPLTHAFTVYIANALVGFTLDLASKNLRDLMDQSWDLQISGMLTRSIDTDVDRECLYRLEEDMFEVSARAEMAGYYQWGLGCGHHQDNWDPYLNLPESWNIGDHMFDEDLLEIGPSYIQYEAPIKQQDVARGTVNKPQPRRKAGSKKKDQ
ncbi:hypothetical protein BJ165DRAFT_1409161 [Panaeolus papilionaceus]|nr:hypothetical protein BJ165DRAFT_1409161 [Panaeolus papilionaceus]